MLGRIFVADLLWMFAVALHGAVPPPQTALITTEAELLKEMDARALHEGDVFYLKTGTAWQWRDCTLRAGTTVSGRVVVLKRRHDGAKQAALGFEFEPMPCALREGTIMRPLLVAMRSAPVPAGEGLRRLETAGLEEQALHSIFNPNPPPSVAQAARISTANNAVPVINTSGFSGPGGEPPVRTGEAKGLRGVKMTLPGSSPVTTLASSQDLRLERHTVFVLTFVPAASGTGEGTRQEIASGGVSEEARTAGIPASSEARGVVAAAPDEVTEVCPAGGCREFATAGGGAAGQAEWRLSLAKLGYRPRLNRVVSGLDDDASVSFLGEDEILLLFNGHSLLRRTAEPGYGPSKPRQIRAVVISRRTGEVLQARDWMVPDDAGPYSWSLEDGRVLLHVGSELVVFGPDLVAEQRYTLPGPLLFVSVAPDGGVLLLATVHERHSREEHGRLADFLGPDQSIEEDYDLTAMDGRLQVIGSKVLGVEPLRPSLLDAAMVSARQDHGDTWKVEEDSWTGQKKTIARLSSFCDVSVSSMPGDLLFAVGCAPGSFETKWYRLLNARGATLLKGTSPGTEYVQQAAGSAAGGVFAIASSEFEEPYYFKLNLRVGDFKRLKVTVYRTSTGEQLLTARPASGSALRQTFALSPAGTGLAVLTDESLESYAVGGRAVAPRAAGRR